MRDTTTIEAVGIVQSVKPYFLDISEVRQQSSAEFLAIIFDFLVDELTYQSLSKMFRQKIENALSTATTGKYAILLEVEVARRMWK